MDKNAQIKGQLKEINKRKKLSGWMGAAIIVTLVFGVVWFFQQPSARADILSNRVLFNGGGGCCNAGTVGQDAVSGTCGQVANSNIDAIRMEAVQYYIQNYGGENIEAVVTDYGCHIQADIYQDGKNLKSLGYSGPGQFYSIN